METRQKSREARFGWKSYALAALVAGVAATKFRRLRRPSSFNQEAKWYAPDESDLRQSHLDELERRERVARMQGAYDSLKSSYRNVRTARYQKWEEHPQRNEEKVDEAKTKEQAASKLKERSRLRHHYAVLGLDPFRDEAFSEEEIKMAFRERALQFHPDKNPDKVEEMRGKFRELVDSYKTIKSEKKII
ncbi:hypothetical protein SELMODRAFT_407197 [Selaginella moellendorffii]|uniref:J domain-containing protein n=1 Tax=Selaginella moellendorffii TaxID=88036 RepID=D8R482_SELML|nr:dnaJ homolog subfamily C member 7 [Selaginella moellendorffii]XP_002989228.1 dnaJ homolog subfamily C member 7 [Selaginella moellendorffii]EFJ09666.1 hypothetical protein SELMODRAFT_427858 [Selaginella moellendorffii]EFJ33418.1 hypothetical protein SELMODRAFT_407197 [Selaginella moellendorffii]|eukprot:XP_002965998.1 dnaJ homolog subfamily C member 7 [Selaginella moellendorffii]